MLGYNRLMFRRDKSLRSFERFVYKKLGTTKSAADLVANTVGVFIEIKPAMQGDWPLELADSKTLWLLKQKFESLRLFIVFDRAECNNRIFFVAKSHKKAEALRSAFSRLANAGPSAEINTRIGELLGYPSSAIQYYIRLHPEKGLSENHRANLERNRFYAHSIAHEDEEFNSYEAPIYRQLRKYCTKTANFYRKDMTKRWLD